MALLTAREREWAGNQFGSGLRTTEDVERAYQRIDEDREVAAHAERIAASFERGGLILTPAAVWFWHGDEEPARWIGSIEDLFNIMGSLTFDLPKRFTVQLRRDCDRCGSFCKLDRSCDCFDNGCQ